RHLLQLVLLVFGGNFLTGPTVAQSGASYTVERRIDTIVLDGNLNEASWQNATQTSAFTFWDGNPAPASLQTTARMIWDCFRRFLTVRFSLALPPSLEPQWRRRCGSNRGSVLQPAALPKSQ